MKHAKRRERSSPRGKRSRSGWLKAALAAASGLLVVGSAGLAFDLAGAAGSSQTGAALAHDPPPAPLPPLRVLSTTPVPGASSVPPDTSLTISLSATLSPASPMPVLSPPMLGTWTAPPGQLTFVPAGSFIPSTTETLTIPGGPSGLVSTRGQHLEGSETVSFGIAAGSVLRLQQLLAQLGYLPVSFVPAAGPPVPPVDEALPQPGSFAWRWAGMPASLVSLWSPGQMNVITTGAVMAFEDQQGIATDGIAGPSVWFHLLQAASSGHADSAPYDYVLVSKVLPEHLSVWSNGAPVFSTLVNTGVAAAPTPDGTWPVYLRYRVTTMSGTNPNGTHYSDPGIPWVSYFNGGDALHGFIRASYGFPQSVGCVEMPFASASRVWPLTPIGTLVTVQ